MDAELLGHETTHQSVILVVASSGLTCCTTTLALATPPPHLLGPSRGFHDAPFQHTNLF